MSSRIARGAHVARGLAETAVVAALVVPIGCSLGSSTPNGPALAVPVLLPRYALTQVNGLTLPYTVANDAQNGRVRLYADTLQFRGGGPAPGDSGTYVERRIVGTQVGGGAETFALTTLGERPWRHQPGATTMELGGFVGAASAAGTVTMRLTSSDDPTLPSQIGAGVFTYTFAPH